MAEEYVRWRVSLAKTLRAMARRVERPSTDWQLKVWEARNEAYRETVRDCERHIDEIYRPALEAFERDLASGNRAEHGEALSQVRRMLFIRHRINEIEEVEDDLAAKREAALRRLVVTQSLSITHFALKLDLIRHDLIVEEPYEGILDSLVKDASWLADFYDGDQS